MENALRVFFPGTRFQDFQLKSLSFLRFADQRFQVQILSNEKEKKKIHPNIGSPKKGIQC